MDTCTSAGLDNRYSAHDLRLFSFNAAVTSSASREVRGDTNTMPPMKYRCGKQHNAPSTGTGGYPRGKASVPSRDQHPGSRHGGHINFGQQ